MATKSVCEFDFERDRTYTTICRLSGIVNMDSRINNKNGKFSTIMENTEKHSPRPLNLSREYLELWSASKNDFYSAL